MKGVAKSSRTKRSSRATSNSRRTQSGSALITSLLVMVVLALLAAALLSTRVAETRAIAGTVRATHAHNIAEAGVDYVLGLIVRDGQTLPAVNADGNYDEVSAGFGGGAFGAVADKDPGSGHLRVISTGEFPAGGVSRTIEVLFEIANTSRIVDDYGVFTCGDLTLGGSAQVVNGDVYTGGDLYIARETAVSNGDVTARGFITFSSGSASITGSATSETSTITAPEGSTTLQRVGGDAVNPTGQATLTDPQVGGDIVSKSLEELYLNYCDTESEYYQDNIEVNLDEYKYVDGDPNNGLAFDAGDQYYGDMHVTNGGTNGYNWEHYIDGNALIEGTPPGAGFDGGIYYITGNLTVKGNFSGSGTFVVEGDLIIEGSSTSGSDEDRAYVVGGNVSMAGGSTVDGLIYTSGNITAEGDATVNGGVVALGTGGVSGSLTVNVESTGSVGLATERVPSFVVERWRLVTAP